MQISFRQGIVKVQTDVNAQVVFLQKSTLNAAFVDLIVSPTPTTITFAHGTANYVFEEPKTVRNAWGPFSNGVTQYLYWDIDLLTAVMTRGITTLPPLYSATPPNAPVTGQHWFDSINTIMQVWNGHTWITKLRVFAAVYTHSAVLQPYPIGSQAGLNTTIYAGSIALDEYNLPIRQSDGTFVTSETGIAVVGMATKRIRFETELLHLQAEEHISQYALVRTTPGKTCILARSSDPMSRVSGIAMEDMFQGQVGLIVEEVLIRYDGWSWPKSSVNRPLFCDITGGLTLTPPTAGVLQQVGSVYDVDTIYVDIYPSITLDDPYAPGGIIPPVTPPAGSPVADFTCVPFTTTGPAPFTVNFVSTSTGSPTLLEWDFTNDGTIDATGTTVSYTFASIGTYNVRLRATNGVGVDEMIKNAFVTVVAAPPTGTYTNLEVNLGGPNQAQSGTIFNVMMSVNNTGYLTATNVQRTFTVQDMGNQIPTITCPSLPAFGHPGGPTSARVGSTTVITLPLIVSMISNAPTVSVTFAITAPYTRGDLKMSATVTSPEVDETVGDNTTALTVTVKP